MNIQDAIKILGVDENFDEQTIKIARNLLLKKLNYDIDTSVEIQNQAARINEAYDYLKKILKEQDYSDYNAYQNNNQSVIIPPLKNIQSNKKTLEEELQDLNNELIEVFNEERDKQIKEGPFNTKELEDFQKKYYEKKINLNEKIMAKKNEIIKNNLKQEMQKVIGIEDKQNKNTPLGIEDKQNKNTPIGIEDKQNKNTPIGIEDKQNKNTPLGIEDKQNKNTPLGIEDKQNKNTPLGIEEKQNKNTPLGIEEKQNKNTPLGIEEKQSKNIPPKPKKGLYEIMAELTDGLEVKKKDNKKYTASNIKVASSFKNELQSGNYLYNVVHIASAVVKVPIKIVGKTIGKITSRKSDRQRIKTLQERISNMSEEDVETVWNEYRGNRIMQEKFPTLINTLLNEKMREYAYKKVNDLNSELESSYLDIFSSYKQIEAINNLLNNSELELAEKKALTAQVTNLLQGKAREIKQIRENYRQAQNYFSGGLHGFEEDVKASATKLSCIGKRFAKDYDLDNELLAKQAEYEQQENKAIAEENNFDAMKSFINAEMLLSSNTEIKNSIFGKRSTGKKYYSPMAEMLDYRDDPFVRDMFTTLAVTGAAVSTVGAVMNAKNLHNIETVKNNEINNANINNTRTMDSVHQTGESITSKSDTFSEGLKSQIDGNVNGATGTIERTVLDKNNWHSTGSTYAQMDQMGHDFYNNFYQTTQNSITDVANRVAAGNLDSVGALEALTKVANESQSTLTKVYQECLPVLEKYAIDHPKFNLTATKETMSYLANNPSAITNMNQAMVDVVKNGQILKGLTVEQVTTLSSLPTALKSTIFGATTSTALAANVLSTMKSNQKKGKYGNEITKMVDEYANQTEKNSYTEQITR